MEKAKLKILVRRYVLFHPEEGILLGVYRGNVFFSYFQSAGQSSAVLFESKEECYKFIEGIHAPEEWLLLFRTVPVLAMPDVKFLHRDSLVKQGLPSWSSLGADYFSKRTH